MGGGAVYKWGRYVGRVETGEGARGEVEGDATVEEGGREMESGIDASRRGPMPGSHFRTDTGGPPCNREKGMERRRDR